MGPSSRQSGASSTLVGGRPAWFVRAAAGALIALASGLAGADEPQLVRIDQGVTDFDPLAISLRQLEPDIRQDLGFEHLYTDPNDPSLFVRRSGAMYAVSPHSWYVVYKQQAYPAVAPGTVFYIGPPPDLDPNAVTPQFQQGGVGEAVSARAVSRVTTAIPMPPVRVTSLATVDAHRIETDRALEAPERSPERPVVRDMTNESYRAARLRQIARSLGLGG